MTKFDIFLQLASCLMTGLALVFAQEFNLVPPTITTHLASSTDRNTGVTRQMYSSLSSFTLSTPPLFNATTTTPRPAQPASLPPVFHFNASLFSLNSQHREQQRSSSRWPVPTTLSSAPKSTTSNYDALDSHGSEQQAPNLDENEINIHASPDDSEDALLRNWHMRRKPVDDGQHHRHRHKHTVPTTTLAPAVTWTNDEPYDVHNSRHHHYNTSFGSSNSPQVVDNYQLDLSMDALGSVVGGIKWVWTRWTPFGPCSTSCGPGLQQQERFCVAQGPQKLLGQDDTFMRCRTASSADHSHIRYRACNADDACFDEISRDYIQDARGPLCAKQSNTTFAGNVRYRWEPLASSTLHGGSPCDLVCKPVNETFYIRFGTLPNGFECQVEQLTGGQQPSPTLATGVRNDGVRHHHHQTSPKKLNGVCVNTTCLEVGCDDIIGSGARRNKCGTCGTVDGYEAILDYDNDDADQQIIHRQAINNQCVTTRRVFSERNLPTGYNTVASIPAAATSINITEMGWSGNSLAIRSDSFGVILDGSKVLDDSLAEEEELVITAVGTRFVFRRGRQHAGWQQHQQILADGPLSEHVDVMLVTKNENPGIEYEYSLAPPANGNTNINDEADRNQHMLLLRHRQLIAAQQATKGVSRPTRMPDSPLLRDTGDSEIGLYGGEARWILTQWSACSATCGMGTQTREIKCQQTMANGEMQDVPFALCGLNADERQYVRSCQQLQPCHDWRVGAWTKCMPNCGPGHQRRLVKCIDLNSGEFATDNFCQGRRPATERDCTEGTCGAYWYTSAWGTCNPECPTPGERSVQSRKVVCLSSQNSSQQVDEHECSALARPIHLRDCPTPPDPLICEPQADWLVGPWSSCALPTSTATCGKGIRRRIVVCVRSYVPTNTKGYNAAEATIIDESMCLRVPALRQKPIEREPCGEECPLNDPGQGSGEWFASEWDPCSLSCLPNEVLDDAVQNGVDLPTGNQARKAVCLQTFTNPNAQISVAKLDDDACAGGGQQRPVTSKTCGENIPRCPDTVPRLQDEFIDDEAYWNRPVQYEKGVTTRTMVPMQQPPPPVPSSSAPVDEQFQFDALQQRRRQQIQTPPATHSSANNFRHFSTQRFHYDPSTYSTLHNDEPRIAAQQHRRHAAGENEIFPTESRYHQQQHRRRQAFDFDITSTNIDNDEPYASVVGLSTLFPSTTTSTTTMSSNRHVLPTATERRQQSQEASSDAAFIGQQHGLVCKDQLQRCRFVKQIGYCVYEYYRDACCQSCSGVM